MFEQTSQRAGHVASSVTRRGLLLSLGRWASPECSPRADRRGRHERRSIAVGGATSSLPCRGRREKTRFPVHDQAGCADNTLAPASRLPLRKLPPIRHHEWKGACEDDP
jgi:hypothetical protein